MYRLAGDAVKAADVPDPVLHEAILASGTFQCIRGRYTLKLLGDGKVDPFRGLVLEILQVCSCAQALGTGTCSQHHSLLR